MTTAKEVTMTPTKGEQILQYLLPRLCMPTLPASMTGNNQHKVFHLVLVTYLSH